MNTGAAVEPCRTLRELSVPTVFVNDSRRRKRCRCLSAFLLVLVRLRLFLLAIVSQLSLGHFFPRFCGSKISGGLEPLGFALKALEVGKNGGNQFLSARVLRGKGRAKEL
jgi:hypothetical protein